MSKKIAMTDFEDTMNKILPLKGANKLGVILLQLPPSITYTSLSYEEESISLTLKSVKSHFTLSDLNVTIGPEFVIM